MPVDHRERAFEAAIEDSLITRGATRRQTPRGLTRASPRTTQFIAFFKETQPETWQSLEKLHGGSTRLSSSTTSREPSTPRPARWPSSGTASSASGNSSVLRTSPPPTA